MLPISPAGLQQETAEPTPVPYDATAGGPLAADPWEAAGSSDSKNSSLRRR